MSTLTQERDQVRRALAPERARVLGRSRRSGEGSVTEMARLLLRDARESGERRAPGGDCAGPPALVAGRVEHAPGADAPIRRRRIAARPA